MNIYDYNLEEIKNIIHNNLSIDINNKNKYGEVFTPFFLIEEMLNKLPIEVWSNPDLKWLDPANGIGNFPMIVFYKLNEGLKDIIKNEKERKEHIIKNMLYMVELNEKNIEVSKDIFGEDANIYCGSFLEDGWKKHFGIDKFDIIMGNPPYNPTKENNKGKPTGNMIWHYFVNNSLDLLENKGYFVFVHPPAWRKPQSENAKTKGLFNKMVKDNTMLYLEIHNLKDGKKTFNAGTRYDWYVIKKQKNNNNPTTIKDELGNTLSLYLKDLPFLPNYNIIEVMKLFDNHPINEENIIFNRSQYDTRKKYVSKEKKNEYKYPLINSTAPNAKNPIFYTNTKTPNVKNFIPMFGVPKVIYGDSGGEPINDYEGKYGMAQHSFGLYIKSKKEGETIIKALKSNIFQNILKSLLFSNFQIDWRLFMYLKPDWYKIILEMEDK